MRTPAEWKVETHIRFPRSPTDSTTRRRISSAALLVKVMARICQGAASPLAIRWAMRRVSTLVFPDPAPATINSGAESNPSPKRQGRSSHLSDGGRVAPDAKYRRDRRAIRRSRASQSLPFDGTGRLGRYVQCHPVDALDLIDDA